MLLKCQNLPINKNHLLVFVSFCFTFRAVNLSLIFSYSNLGSTFCDFLFVVICFILFYISSTKFEFDFFFFSFLILGPLFVIFYLSFRLQEPALPGDMWWRVD